MMADWQRHLKADPTGWLLEDENPSVRYFTLMDILAMIRCGYLTDKRVQKGIDWIIQYKRCDDRNSHAPAGWPYDQFPRTGVCR